MKLKPLRFSILDLYLGIICVFPIFTTLIDGTIINKALFALILGLQVYSMFTNRMKKKTVFLLLWLVVHYVYALGVTDFPVANVNLLFY